MHKATMSSHGISATEGPGPGPGEGLLLFHLRYVLRSRLSTWDWRTGCVWRELGIWEAYWTTMEHTGSQGAGEKAPGKSNCEIEKFAFNFEYNKLQLLRKSISRSLTIQLTNVCQNYRRLPLKILKDARGLCFTQSEGEWPCQGHMPCQVSMNSPVPS
ncbi:hypothetical protein CB1_001169010 [Camelus ferus]|nr:hypothetical protein CB1_001169010 [Camelus ferus]